MSMIIESELESASNADILNGTRLATAPSNGMMLISLQASVASAANNFVVTIQLPGGDNPLSEVLVPAGTSATAGIIDDRTALQIEVPVPQGGQVLMNATLTGTSVLTWRCVFRGT